MSKGTSIIIPAERIHRSILLVRRNKVILDKDLAEIPDRLPYRGEGSQERQGEGLTGVGYRWVNV